MLIKTDGAQPQDARYVFTDRLGSVVKYTNAQGVVVQPQDFDGWGQRRNPTDPSQAGTAPVSPPGLRGFTGHEMVDGQDVIHMNARLYDPILGRFLQADPLVQAPQNLQSWNAYTYVLNNPLTLIDPTGMFSWRKLLGVFGQILNIVSYFIPILKPFAMAFNMVMAFANGGLKGGLLSAFGSFIPGVDNILGSAAIGALYGGVSSMIMGGSFKQGIMGSLKSAAIGMVLGAMAQGVKSRQTGRKYGNGADTEAGHAVVESPSSSMSNNTDQSGVNVTDPHVGGAAMMAADKALGDDLDITYPSMDAAAIVWSDKVQPIASKFDTEISSKFFKVRGGYRIGATFSDGVICSRSAQCGVSTPLAPDIDIFGAQLSGYIHTHPGNANFSGNDLFIAHSFFKQTGMHQMAYVSLPNGRIYSWSTTSWANTHPGFSDWQKYSQFARRVR